MLGNLFEKYGRYKKYRKTVDELWSMSDRDLYDIGITRYDIKRVARDHANKK